MIFSLIVTTRNRISELIRFFDSIEKQLFDFDCLEVIFINQSKVRLDTFYEFKNVVNFIEIITEPKGLSAARNIGLKISKGTIVCFPDDDCWYDSFVLKNVYDFFKSNLDFDILCLNVFDPIKNISYGKRPLDVMREVDFGNLFELPISVGIFIKMVNIDRKDVYFREDLGAGSFLGSGEETELLFRLKKLSNRIIYNGYYKVFHPVYEFSSLDYDKYYSYGIGFGYLNCFFLKKGYFEFFPFFINILIRTVGGILINIFNFTKCRLYFFRFKGILRGFILCLSKL